MMRKCAFGFIGAILVGLAGTADAAIITFDDIPNTGNAIQTSVTSTGFDFNGAHFHIIDSPLANVVRNASTSYLASEKAFPGDAVTMTRSGGGTFTLNQMDIAEIWLPGDPFNDFLDVRITANQFGGGVFGMLVRLDGIRDGAGGVADFQSVSFVGWTNLIDVTITGVNGAGAFGDYSVDNIVVDDQAAVPEPATLLLLGAGLGAASVRRRLKRG